MRARPARGRQAFAWHYLRVSGVLIVALVFVHLFVMHYASLPSAATAAFVGARWAAAGWRAFDWMLLLLALTHGVVGAHAMLRDVARRPLSRTALDVTAGAVTAAFLGLGTAVILMAAPPGDRGPLSSYTWIPSLLTGGLVTIATAAYVGVLAAGAALGMRLARRDPIGRWNYPGQWMFAINRTAGAGVLGFLLVHVLDVALFPFAPDLYDRTVAAYAMPYLIPMEAGLVAAVVYHAFDGLRLMLLEALDRRASRMAAPSFIALVVLTISLSLPALAVLLGWRP